MTSQNPTPPETRLPAAQTAQSTVFDEIATCTLCADRFAATHTAHTPRPVFQFASSARILIVGQAPGARVHASGRPFTDPSGDRLRDWMGVTETEFYDARKIAILPMAFCFPGYNAKGADLPPPPLCARVWRPRLTEVLPPFDLTLLIGGYAQGQYLGKGISVTQRVSQWRELAPGCFPLPHPSWRNTAWLKKNSWFASELLPVLQTRIRDLLS